jgi:hypothetical protein
MDFPPFVMVYHKRTQSPIHAEPKHIMAGFFLPGLAKEIRSSLNQFLLPASNLG